MCAPDNAANQAPARRVCESTGGSPQSGIALARLAGGCAQQGVGENPRGIPRLVARSGGLPSVVEAADALMALLLCAPPADWKAGSALVVASVALKRTRKRKIEPAGRGYQALVRGGVYVDIEEEGRRAIEAAMQRRAARQGEGGANRMVVPKDVDHSDCYALLGLSEKNAACSDQDIKTAYKRLSLLYHPDKAPMEEREDAEALYKAMQEAYEKLSDPARRRAYDSELPFDDSLPPSGAGAGDPSSFFSTYKPAFTRNARWSTIKPVPDLGDMNSSDDQVNSFYDFWLGFQSWREFKHKDEHRVEEAEGRDEKRWMMQHNKRLVAGQVKAEKKRIRKLVDNAMKLDPRLAKIRAKQREERAAKRRAREAKARAREAARVEAENAERRRQEQQQEVAAEAEAEAKRARAAKKKLRKKLKYACKRAGFSPVEIELVIDNSTDTELSNLLSALKPSPNPDPNSGSGAAAAAAAIFQTAVSGIRDRKRLAEEKRQAAMAESRAKRRLEEKLAQEREAKRAKWADIELMWLAKAVQKFPAGCHNRWLRVRDMVNQMAKNSGKNERSEKEVIKQARIMNQKKLQTGFSTAYNKSLKFSAGDGTVQVPSTLPSKESEQPAPTAAAKPKKKKKKRKKREQEAKKAGLSDAGTASAAGAAAGAAADAKAKPAAEAAEWTALQQQAFEQALRTTPKGPEKWDKIAEKVPGKSRKECVRRFKQIRAKILAARKASKK